MRYAVYVRHRGGKLFRRAHALRDIEAATVTEALTEARRQLAVAKGTVVGVLPCPVGNEEWSWNLSPNLFLGRCL